MAENNRSQQQSPGSTTGEDQNRDEANQTQTSSGQRVQDQNPQQGTQWNNYQTRELGEGGTEGNASTGRG